MSIHDQLIAKLRPVLAEIGYDKLVTVKARGAVLSIKFIMSNGEDLDGLLKKPSVECYVSDMYPNDKGEAFMCCWNWIGMPGGMQRVAEHLTKRGIRARVTTHKKLKGVRFDFSDVDYLK